MLYTFTKGFLAWKNFALKKFCQFILPIQKSYYFPVTCVQIKSLIMVPYDLSVKENQIKFVQETLNRYFRKMVP